MIKCDQKEKELLEGLCHVVLRATGSQNLAAVNTLLSLLEVEKEAPKKPLAPKVNRKEKK